MKIHVIFVEPANYTQDLIENVYKKLNINYSFLLSNSEATNHSYILSTATHIFSRSSFLRNIKFLWSCVCKNELIIINGYNHFEFIILWIFSFFNKTFIGIESDTPYRKTKGIKGLIKIIYLRMIFSNKRILGLSGGKGLHMLLFSNYGMPEERIFLLPMMVNNAKYFLDFKEKKAHNANLNFLFVGRLVPEKNLSLLIKSFLSILEMGKSAMLNMVGDGVCEAEVKALIGNKPGINLLGKKYGIDLLKIYHSADVLILTSCSERWGLVINEALSAGVPVICSSAVGAAEDLIANPDAGWIFNDNNQLELTNLLIEIIDQPKQIIEKGLRGQEFMLNNWNYQLYFNSLNKVKQYVNRA